MVARLLPLAASLCIAGCADSRSGSYGCGIAAVAGQSLLLEEFTHPGKTLSVAPQEIPGNLPVRMALGPALRALAGRTDSSVVVGIEGELPATPQVGFGVLIVAPGGGALGVILYQGNPIQNAPLLGTVNAGERNLPLIGLQADLTRFQDASCPIFPDSLRR
jgi:hypothetical protein